MDFIKESLRKFTKSYLYFLVTSLLVLLFWYFDMPIYGMLFASIFLLMAALFSDNLIQLPAIMSLFYMAGRSYENAKLSLYLIIPTVLFAVASIVIIFIRFKNKISLKKITENKLIYCYLLMFFVMMLSIINSEYKMDTLGNSMHYFSSILIFVIASMFVDLSKKEDRFKFLHSFIFICIAIFFQYVIHVAERYDGSNFIDFIRFKDNLLIGWSHPNHCLILFNMTFAMSIYLFINNKKLLFRIIYVGFAFLTILIAFLIKSRGGQIGFGLVIVSYASYYLIKNNKTRKPFLITAGIVVTLAIVGVICLSFTQFFKDKLAAFDSNEFTSSRSLLWEVGINQFKNNLIIGYGVGTSQHYIFQELGRTEANYHSYVVQITQAGIIGIIAFLILLAGLIYNLRKLDDFNIMLSSVIIMFIIWGLIDTLFFNMRIEPFFVLLMAFKSRDIKMEGNEVLA